MITVTSAQDRLTRITALFDLHWYEYADYQCSRDERGCADRWFHVQRLTEGDSAYMGDLHNTTPPTSADDYLQGLPVDDTDPGEVYFSPPYMGGSDYSGCTYTKANADSFIESYSDKGFVWPSYGGYNSWDVVIGLTGLLRCDDDTFDEVMSILEGLEDYPVVDDEAVSAVESEGIDEAWAGWVSSDFTRRLEKDYEDEGIEFIWPDDDKLRELFEASAQTANEYWYNEGYGPDMYIHVDRVADATEWADIEAYAIRYKVSWIDVGAESEDYFDEADARIRVGQLRSAGFIGASYRAVIGENDESVDDEE